MALESLEEYYAGDNGQAALEQFIEERFGLKGAARTRAAAQLRDFQCGCWNVCAHGASS
jgi:hypothetical protein